MEGVCFCGNRVYVCISWTYLNPGRRFRSCHICGYFNWVDPPMCERSRQIIPGLFQRIREIKAGANRARERFLWVVMFCLWVLIVILFLRDMEEPNIGENNKDM